MSDMVTVSFDPITVIFGATIIGIGSGIGSTLGKELYEEHIRARAKRFFNGIAKNGKQNL